jgi:K(+)-stimulated pyrophosphate-energized sodium pump
MLTLAIGSALAALAIVAFETVAIARMDQGTARVREVGAAIREGASAFLRREYAVVAAFIAAIVLAIVLAFGLNATGGRFAIGFVLGAAGGALASAFAVVVAVRGNVRTAAVAAHGDLAATTHVALRAGSVVGLGVAALAMLELVGTYALFGGDVPAMAGMLVGASLISLFARVGGGIYTKGADIGADLVGKLEIAIPEDDPRNPAVIADNVGDNVGDCGGMAADLFETFLVTATAAMLLGQTIPEVRAAFPNAVLFPVAICACGLFASVVGTLVVRVAPRGALLARGLGVTLAASAAGTWLIAREFMAGDRGIYMAALAGLAVVVAVIVLTDYYTSARHRPVERILGATEAGAGPVVISGMSVGLASVWLPGLAIAAGMLAAFFATGWTDGHLAPALGLYGIAVAATSMLAVMAMIVSLDAFGPIVDNAGGIAELAALPEQARATTDALDAVGNTTKAITKGYAIGSAALGALTLFAAFTVAAAKHLGVTWADFTSRLALGDPLVVVGLFVGALLPFVFASRLMNAVGAAANAIVREVRRQFTELRLAEGEARPEYARCVAIVTTTALRQLLAPGLLAIAVPLAIGFLLGPMALAGVLLGVVLSGLPLALVLTTSGAAWDNAKKYIEEGHLGGKRSPAHGAAIVGDTVGDAAKDAAGPAINPLVKVVNTVSLLCVSLIVHRGA